jgi:predicted PurR-regulated permease PerM
MARGDRGHGPTGDGFARRVVTTVAVVAAAAILLLLAWQAASVLLVVFAGVLVGVLLRGMADMVARRTGWSPALSLTVACSASALVVLALLAFAATSIALEVSEMIDRLPQAVEQVRERLSGNPLGERLLAQAESSAEGAGGDAMPGRVAGMASQVVGGVGTAVLVAFLGIFLAADPSVYRRGLLLLVPPSRRARLEDVLDEANDTLLRWLAGRLLLMAVIGVLTWLGLLLLGVPLALALGVIAGLLSFIPNLGPVISLVPAMLMAVTVDPVLAVWVAVYYLLLQAAESYLLEPYVVRRSVSLPPATNIAFQLLMGTWLGLAGLTLATPLLALLVVLATRLYIEDVLGDDGGPPVSETAQDA